MPTTDVNGGFQERQIAVFPHILQNFRADQRVTVHHLGFLCRQLARFVENPLVDADFADIMQHGSSGDHFDIFGRKRVTVGHAGQLFQKKPRQAADVQNCGIPLRG